MLIGAIYTAVGYGVDVLATIGAKARIVGLEVLVGLGSTAWMAVTDGSGISVAVTTTVTIRCLTIGVGAGVVAEFLEDDENRLISITVRILAITGCRRRMLGFV